MARRKKRRRVSFLPELNHFRPISKVRRPRVILERDEVEALRLADFDGIDQEKAAEKMGISQSTFQRILERARHKVSEALIIGKELLLKGGESNMNGRNRRYGRKVGGGPGGYCVCTNSRCGYKVLHEAGKPCYQQKCPKCGSPMIREEAAEVFNKSHSL